MQVSSLMSSIHSGTGTRVLAPFSAAAAAAADAMIAEPQPRVLPKRSLADALAELHKGAEKEKDAESK
jgi:hypothetical protein